MDASQIKKFAEAIGSFVDSSKSRRDWVHISCPLAPWRHEKGTDSSPSCGIKLMPGDSKIYCFSCSFAGTATSLLLTLRVYLSNSPPVSINLTAAYKILEESEKDWQIDFGPDYQEWFERKEKPPHEFPEWFLDALEPAYYDGCVHPYLEYRKVPFEVAKQLDIRWDTYSNRVVFPIREWAGKLMGLHGRDVTGQSSLRYLAYKYEEVVNSVVWFGENWVKMDRPVVVVESVFDLARVFEVYKNVICPLSSGLSAEKIKRISSATEIIHIWDMDKAGQRAFYKVKSELKSTIHHHVRLPEGKDPGDMDAAWLKSAISEYVVV